MSLVFKMRRCSSAVLALMLLEGLYLCVTTLRRASSLGSRAARVFTFATRTTPELRVLQQCTRAYGGGALAVQSDTGAYRNFSVIEPKGRKAGALVASTGAMRDDEVYVYADGFDTIVQQSLVELVDAFDDFLSRRRISRRDGIVAMGEQNCWPWPKHTSSRMRGVSMQYMRNATLVLQNGTGVRANDVCGIFETRHSGLWKYPNAGVLMGTGRALKGLARCYLFHMRRGHFDDQAILGLCALGDARVVVDTESELFLSHYAYNKDLFSAEACKTGYLDAQGRPPYVRATGRRPFILHFNGPSGRYRMKECMRMFAQACAS